MPAEEAWVWARGVGTGVGTGVSMEGGHVAGKAQIPVQLGSEGKRRVTFPFFSFT